MYLFLKELPYVSFWILFHWRQQHLNLNAVLFARLPALWCQFQRGRAGQTLSLPLLEVNALSSSLHPFRAAVPRLGPEYCQR